MLNNIFKKTPNLSFQRFCLQPRLAIHTKKPTSLFDLKNPESHKAIKLSNQDSFKGLQKETIKALTETIKMNKGLYERLYNKQSYILFLKNGDSAEVTQDFKFVPLHGNNISMSEAIKNLLDDKIFKDKYTFITNLGLQAGTNISDVLHKDNGRDQKMTGYEYDYTIVIPVLNYDLSANKNHDFNPESTCIIPQDLKHNIPDYDKSSSSYKRGTVFYNNLPKDVYKQFLVSEKLTDGTAIILHTVQEKEDANSKSVLHISPETPVGYVRCFVFVRANSLQ